MFYRNEERANENQRLNESVIPKFTNLYEKKSLLSNYQNQRSCVLGAVSSTKARGRVANYANARGKRRFTRVNMHTRACIGPG